ncbi:hypothetical protein V1514DRAFT_324339 [Lipomyces japonicus]|uniref:uncharacterized protein n=1 Tax=Lipomyces japonicus TaxID=56871 RepID=UPI0034CE922E
MKFNILLSFWIMLTGSFVLAESGSSKYDIHCHRNHKAVRSDCERTLTIVQDPGDNHGTVRKWGWGRESCAIVVWQTALSQNVSTANVRQIAGQIIDDCFEGEKSKKSGVVQGTFYDPKVCVCGMNNMHACFK